MTTAQRNVVIALSCLSLLGGIAWQVSAPGFEPWLFVVVGLSGLFSVWWPTRTAAYASRRLRGTVNFNYSNNNGRYAIGEGALLFETAWSKASDSAIHIYNDPPSIAALALVRGQHEISALRSLEGLDFSSRSRTPEEGDIILLKNKYGNYAAVKIMDIKDCTRSDSVDEVTFEYLINPDGGTDFK